MNQLVAHNFTDDSTRQLAYILISDDVKNKIVDIIKSKFIRKILKLRYDQLKNIEMIYDGLNVISRKDKYDGIEIEVEGDVQTVVKIENLINK